MQKVSGKMKNEDINHERVQKVNCLSCHSWKRSWSMSRRRWSRPRTSWTNFLRAWKTPKRSWNCQRRRLQTWVKEHTRVRDINTPGGGEGGLTAINTEERKSESVCTLNWCLHCLSLNAFKVWQLAKRILSSRTQSCCSDKCSHYSEGSLWSLQKALED